MKRVKLIIIMVMLIGTFISCKKDNEEYIILSKNVHLLIDETNTGILLNWNPPFLHNFSSYVILRSENINNLDYLPYDYNYDYYYIRYNTVASISDFNTTTYTDTDAPYVEKLYYKIYAIGDTIIESNVQIFERSSNKFINYTPSDAVKHPTQNWLYLTDKINQKIDLYDCELDSITKSISFNSSDFGFMTIGNNNGATELYVPIYNKLYTINTSTLSLVASENFDDKIYSVISNNNGLLFLGTSDYYQNIKVYDISSKTIIAYNGNNGYARLKMIPGRNYEFIGISNSKMGYYQFNSTTLNSIEKYYSGMYNSDENNFEFFPDGDKFITSSYGEIFDNNLDYMATLPTSETLINFAFDDINNAIYAGIEGKKEIFSFSISDYSFQKKYKTKAYPYMLFLDGNSIISISKNNMDKNNPYIINSSTQAVIEKISIL